MKFIHPLTFFKSLPLLKQALILFGIVAVISIASFVAIVSIFRPEDSLIESLPINVPFISTPSSKDDAPPDETAQNDTGATSQDQPGQTNSSANPAPSSSSSPATAPSPPAGGGDDSSNSGSGNNDGSDDEKDAEPETFSWPSASNTGPRSAPNKVYNNEFGSDYGATAYRITTDGAVIEGYTINRCVVIFANNVTIRDSVVTCAHNIAAIWPNGASNTTIEYNEIIGAPITDPSAAGFICSNTCTAKRNKISGTADGIKAGSNSTIIENYVGQLRGGTTSSGGTHNDGMQIEGSGIANVVIKNNTIDHDCNSQDSGSCNTAIWIQGTVSNMTIDHNYFKKWQSYFVVRGNGSNVTGIKVINNVFQIGGVSGTKIAFTGGATASKIACNINSDNTAVTDAGNQSSPCPAT